MKDFYIYPRIKKKRQRKQRLNALDFKRRLTPKKYFIQFKRHQTQKNVLFLSVYRVFFFFFNIFFKCHFNFCLKKNANLAFNAI